MNCNTPEDVARLISVRDGISFNEALAAVRDCMNEIELAIQNGDIYQIDYIIMGDLGLEPEYLDCLIM